MNHTVPSSYRRSASSTYLNQSTISQQINHSLVLEVGSITSKENTMSSVKRTYNIRRKFVFQLTPLIVSQLCVQQSNSNPFLIRYRLQRRQEI